MKRVVKSVVVVCSLFLSLTSVVSFVPVRYLNQIEFVQIEPTKGIGGECQTYGELPDLGDVIDLY